MSTPPVPVAAGLPCPRCGVDLVMSERAGIEIDYCPKCRGVWLDRGELDKIIERAAAQFEEQPAPAPPAGPPPGPQAGPWAGPGPQYAPPPPQPGWGSGHGGGHGGKHGGGGHGSQYGGQYGGHRRKSWLREIFD
jgi:Zn-finger nucleic acid-binding protein